MPPSRTRIAQLVVLAAAAALTLGTAEPASAAPTVTLLSPANGQTETLQPDAYVTYRWQISWPDPPPSGTVIVYWQLSTDPFFGPGQLVGSESQSCSVQNYACWTSWTPPRAYGPPFGRTFYWRVSVNNVPSAVGSFSVRLAPDLVKPRVRAFGGSARRGTTAHFMAWVADDRGLVRYRASLEYRNRPVMARSFPFLQGVWGAPLQFWSAQPLPRRMRSGRYQFCLTAWDQTGNRARSCALYRIR